MYQASDQVLRPFYVMAAWQVFEMASPLTRLALRHHGCFSVDRERTDFKAFKKAVQVLCDEPHPLVIFPEGEVYHCNDRVTPFREGAAAIALTAAKRSKRPIACVPCGIKYHYVQDPLPELAAVMDRLEDRILWRPRPEVSLQDRLYAFGEALLTLKELEYLGSSQTGSLTERVASLTNHVLDTLENRYGKSGQEQQLPERVKSLRQRVIKVLETETTNEKDRATGEQSLEDIFFVVQLFSYPGDYVSQQPTVERLAETLDKFEEDVLRAATATVRATRHAVIEFGEPVPLTQENPQTTARELSDVLEHRVQTILDGIECPSKFGPHEKEESS
jgi:hypothetical protein